MVLLFPSPKCKITLRLAEEATSTLVLTAAFPMISVPDVVVGLIVLDVMPTLKICVPAHVFTVERKAVIAFWTNPVVAT
jgi:hypothetical protein